MSSAKAAARYIERGWYVVPIPHGKKGPQLAGWQRLRLTASDVPRYFTNGQNVGIINGEASGWLVTADLDCPEAVKIAGRFLEPTLTSGREPVPDGHWWYVSPGLEHREFEGIPKTASEGTLLELRSTDHQTVVEPSVHPSGERYRWSRSGLEPLGIDANELTAAARRPGVGRPTARGAPGARGRPHRAPGRGAPPGRRGPYSPPPARTERARRRRRSVSLRARAGRPPAASRGAPRGRRETPEGRVGREGLARHREGAKE